VPIWPAAQMGRVPLWRWRAWRVAGSLLGLDAGGARQPSVVFNLRAAEGFRS